MNLVLSTELILRLIVPHIKADVPSAIPHPKTFVFTPPPTLHHSSFRKALFIHSCVQAWRNLQISFPNEPDISGPGGGGALPYISYIGMCRPKGYGLWFLSRFGLKTGIDFDHYGLKSGMVYKGTTGAYKRICLFNSK